jgi:acyl-CoA reductase-like NAD-dependent aldehyde dehydrogenase
VSLRSINPRSGEVGPEFESAAPADVARAAAAAAGAFALWSALPGVRRADVLRAAASALEAHRAGIVAAADFETALGEARLSGELDRTAGQLRAFADLVTEGSYVEAVISPAAPDATPPRPDIRRMLVPIGPVGVFTPSNFPLAFGILGGDTASALAAGCPVVVKGHPSHPATSAHCATAMAEAVRVTGAPDGIFALLQSSAPDVSRALVQAPEMAAVGFTGSFRVGRLLSDLAAARPTPIPFYGELGSLNPLFVAPAAATGRADTIAEGLAASITLGAGQFCTKPGVVFVPTGPAGDRLVALLAARMAERAPAPLLNAGLQATLGGRLEVTASTPDVREVTPARAVPADGCYAAPRVFETDAQTFFSREELREEHFGPVAIVIRCDPDHTAAWAARLDGQLTASVHAETGDADWVDALLPLLAARAGRLVWNGYPTGVAVVPAMQHGGPYPSSTASLHTSVGATAIRRFLRPVAFQGLPDPLLPPALRRDNPLGLQRLVDGEWIRA